MELSYFQLNKCNVSCREMSMICRCAKKNICVELAVMLLPKQFKESFLCHEDKHVNAFIFKCNVLDDVAFLDSYWLVVVAKNWF